jgi:hypothetical protein
MTAKRLILVVIILGVCIALRIFTFADRSDRLLRGQGIGTDLLILAVVIALYIIAVKAIQRKNRR